MPKGLTAVDRRHRRLQQLQDTGQFEPVNRALQRVWADGRRPDRVHLRLPLLHSRPEDPAPPLTQLLNPRGIALRFYLLAVFEAHCRLEPGEAWTSRRALTGRLGWSDFVAVDAGYSSQKGSYLHDEVLQYRDGQSCRVRQVQGALRTLEGVGGGGQALVHVPRKENGARDYAAFSLMPEGGSGGTLTPDRYVLPHPRVTRTFSIPVDFFLQGWVQVLTPAEVATWLVLQLLSQEFPDKHRKWGVYLYADKREGYFRLKRDSYEDSCNALRSFGLIREPRLPSSVVAAAQLLESRSGGFSAKDFLRTIARKESSLGAPPKYEAHRHHMADEGLGNSALKACMQGITFRRKRLRG
ncbi:hypothetical protein AB0D54_24365 [Streptomyces xanthophaeus]|uniref:hypothetical protein n=1 Tax=Streptomyces xanthophaeus TaxID=67385 RepID=UPI00341B4A50